MDCFLHKNRKNEFEKILKNYDNKTRSQDLPELICPSGATWISNIKKLNKTGTFYSQGYKFHKISWLDAVDIDNIDDLQLAKAAFMIKDEKL